MTPHKQEWVYTHWFDDQDNDERWSAHLIVKKTAKKVVVTRDFTCCDDQHNPIVGFLTDGHSDQTIHLDRQTLETEGRAWSSRMQEYFYVAPWKRTTIVNDTDATAATVLGLTLPCGLHQLKTAYRQRSRETHPDSGGSSENFQEVNRAYEHLLTRL